MLPKIDVPVYTIKLISTGKEIKYRPFTVKEEKLFLMASESKEIETIVDTTKQVLKDRKSTRLNSSHIPLSRMPSSA